jgi:hypothetical protein
MALKRTNFICHFLILSQVEWSFSQSAILIPSRRCQRSSAIAKTALRARLETMVSAISSMVLGTCTNFVLYLVQVTPVGFLRLVVHISS